MIDTGPLLRRVAELAEDLERDYGPEAYLLVGAVAVEVIVPGDDDDLGGSIVEHRSTTSSVAHVLGLVELVGDSLRTGFDRED